MSVSLTLAIGAALLGAILGSFLNALSFRFNTGKSILWGRSRCMRCGHDLGAADLVPIFSYLFLRGRCRWCGTRISLQYPLVELLGAVLSLGTYLLNPEPLSYLLLLLIWLTILFIVVYDLRHKIIPVSASAFLLFLVLVNFFLNAPTLLGYAAGPLLASPLFLLSLISWGRWMGWADSGFELSLGWLLGLSAGATGLLFGIWSGALVGIGLLLSTKGFKLKSEMPLAPLLALGAAIVYFFHVDLFSTISLW